MFELIQISNSDYYIQSPAKIGLVRLDENKVCLIDSGNDKDAGKKIRKILDTNNWELTDIYNTHSHADHIGGNRYLQEQTGCNIYAPAIESSFTEHTLLEPTFLYGGLPCKDLRHKFLMAPESKTLPLTENTLPKGFEIIELPGHSYNMVGFRTPDDTVFLADCLSSKKTLDKYQIGFIYDVGSYLKTLEYVKTMKARLFVPSHADATEDITQLAQYNIDKVNEIAETILSLCAQPISFETLLQKLFTAYDLTMTFEQHALVGSTVRSYLSWLKDGGKLAVKFENNMLLWQKI